MTASTQRILADDATGYSGRAMARTLRDHYACILRDGLAGQESGDHKLF